MTTQNPPNNPTPDILYHTLLEVLLYHDESSGSARSTYPLGTHTSLPAAQIFATKALQELDYQSSDFEAYSILTPDTTAWPHGPKVLVYAKFRADRHAGHTYLVKLDATQNNPRLLPAGGKDDGGTPKLPEGVDQLYYVIRSCTVYGSEVEGGAQYTSEVRNVYLYRDDAVAAARGELTGERERFSQYDERDGVSEDEWPFGDDVVVRGIAQTGECYTVAVRTVGETVRKFGNTLDVERELELPM